MLLNCRKIAIALLLCLFLNSLLFIPEAKAGLFSSSSLAGLVTMKNMAERSTPYNLAMKNNQPTILEFYANWCTTCQGMALTMENLESEYGEKFNFVMLDIDDPQWVDIIQQYRVTGVPQFTFLDRDRHTQKTLVGKVPRSIMTQYFAQLL
ncbi:thioredoxin domain-containing protein [Spirulina sp. 06S082]|uniref:thioredoxin domain-containing protein n=1 Tax=Spirulina sp. 06S082 TaxID=3110248 RepID=UPI002B200D74|nr:thioredoxin domain-containing protein [Spirulina sp. 06S082]MEA5471151.1 thioredoxin domain-containing protein [Spirulina sp. 06S082]